MSQTTTQPRIYSSLKGEALRRVNRTLVIEQARLAQVMSTRAGDDGLFKAYAQLDSAIDHICNYLNPDS
jgi:hypothetical protein